MCKNIVFFIEEVKWFMVNKVELIENVVFLIGLIKKDVIVVVDVVFLII